jgi:hypothetical protein
MKIVNFFLWQPQTIVKTKKPPTIMRRFILRNGGAPFPNRRSTAKLVFIRKRFFFHTKIALCPLEFSG